MPKIYEGKLDAKNKHFGIVISRFNNFISQKLLEGAIDCLKRHGADEKNIDIIWVPGAFELALFAQKLARTKKYNALLCLGAVIRGNTPHFEYVSSQMAKGIASVSLSENLPVIFGVLTADTIEQAIERAGTKAGNKGWDAALSAIETADLSQKI